MPCDCSPRPRRCRSPRSIVSSISNRAIPAFSADWRTFSMAYRTTPKMQQRKEEQRAHLLETAVRLFGKQASHATTAPMIVKAGGSSTGNFYFYFRNKEDVFASALESFGKRIADALNAAI